MKDVLMITHFTQTPGEAGNARFAYLASLLADKFNVEVVTTDFSHRTKSKRTLEKNEFDKLNYKLTLLNEPGYKKNVSLTRFYSHWKFGKSLKKYLENRKKPDVVYCSVPSLDAASVAAKYSKKNGIPFIIDIQDLWPEAFEMVFSIPVISKLVFMPFRIKANYAYKEADLIVGVSETFINRAVGVNKKFKKKEIVFLGTILSLFDAYASDNPILKKEKDCIWIGYIGTLGHSYDLKTVIDSLVLLKNKPYYNKIKLIVIGDGPLRGEFEKYANCQGISAAFTGRIPYSNMVATLNLCDVAVNPIKMKSAGTILNKHADYAAAGIAVVNSQECHEYRELVDKYEMGINAECENAIDISQKIGFLIENESVRTKMGLNARKCAEENFDREVTYKRIVKLIEDENEIGFM